MEENQQFTEGQLFETMFIQLVLAMNSEAMWLLGKIVHPVTQKVERDLLRAKGSIDMLRMLREKTKGNLGKNEEQLMDKIISELQMNYLEEMKKPAEPAADAGTGAGEAKAEEANKTAGEKPRENGTDQKKKKKPPVKKKAGKKTSKKK